MSQQLRLHLLADKQSFWFLEPPGEPLPLDRLGKKRDALQALLQQRFPLSASLQQRIQAHEKNSSTRGFLCQLCVGILLPAGLLTQNAWDYDRDMDVLRREASVVLAAHFPPGEFELQEHIDSETSFKNGKLLFALYLN